MAVGAFTVIRLWQKSLNSLLQLYSLTPNLAQHAHYWLFSSHLGFAFSIAHQGFWFWARGNEDSLRTDGLELVFSWFHSRRHGHPLPAIDAAFLHCFYLCVLTLVVIGHAILPQTNHSGNIRFFRHHTVISSDLYLCSANIFLASLYVRGAGTIRLFTKKCHSTHKQTPRSDPHATQRAFDCLLTG